MQLYPAAVPFPSGAQVPNPPGMTPVTTHVRVAHVTALGAGTSGRLAVAGAESPTAPRAQWRVLEFLEDVLLLLLVVFAAPAVIMLLALPIALIFRIAGEIGRRW
jgi:hypothetical protein